MSRAALTLLGVSQRVSGFHLSPRPSLQPPCGQWGLSPLPSLQPPCGQWGLCSPAHGSSHVMVLTSAMTSLKQQHMCGVGSVLGSPYLSGREWGPVEPMLLWSDNFSHVLFPSNPHLVLAALLSCCVFERTSYRGAYGDCDHRDRPERQQAPVHPGGLQGVCPGRRSSRSVQPRGAQHPPRQFGFFGPPPALSVGAGIWGQALHRHRTSLEDSVCVKYPPDGNM